MFNRQKNAFRITNGLSFVSIPTIHQQIEPKRYPKNNQGLLAKFLNNDNRTALTIVSAVPSHSIYSTILITKP